MVVRGVRDGATGQPAAETGVPRDLAVRTLGEPGQLDGSAVEALADYAQEEMAAVGAPGMTFCLVEADGLAAVGALGWADVDRRVPVSHAHLFEIGSISKSFAALCVHRLADEGRLDLDAPLSNYLPDALLPAEPILVQQVLSHTAGLPEGAPAAFPRVPEERLWTGFVPGTDYAYSDAGYELIGLLVESIWGTPYPRALRELVLEPLEITGVREVIQSSDRSRYAVGYSSLITSGPGLPGVALGQAPWVNWANAAGNIAATAEAMAPYLQYLISVGQGFGQPLMSDSAAQRFGSPVEPAASGYASGLSVIDLQGHPAFYHDGTMAGFTSAMTVDPVSGVGCFVSVNARIAGYRPSQISDHACVLMRHARDGGVLPARPGDVSHGRVKEAERFRGTYVARDRDRFELVVSAGRLFLVSGGQRGRVHPSEGNGLLTDHPRFDAHVLVSQDDGGAVEGFWFGAVLYGRGDAPRPDPVVPRELTVLEGCYVSEDPRVGRALVIAQGDRLVLEWRGSADPLIRADDHWRLGPCEQVRFLNAQNGVPQCLNISGRPDLWRFEELD